MERLKNPKLLAWLAMAALAVTVFLQNRQAIEVNVIFLATVHTTLATALCAAFLGGAATGIAACSLWRSRQEKARTANGSSAA